MAQDVRSGFVSSAGTYEDYGVVLDPETLAVDWRATRRRRRSRPASKLFHRGIYFD
ncbi:MAG TPA: hypothetical protein VFO78_10935 [Candidatus Limnocylindrales bacterium]|nr:hypothetical protein [Candidatus Limnocylindrales bacterium]